MLIPFVLLLQLQAPLRTTDVPKLWTVAVSADASVISANHKLFGNALAGELGMLKISRADSPLSARLGFERTRGTGNRVGSTCTGLLFPTDICLAEPLRDQSKITEVIVGAGFRVLTREQLAVTVFSDLRTAHLYSHTRGTQTGGSLSAAQTNVGALFGLEGAWQPNQRIPLALEASGALGGVTPFRGQDEVDGYTPFRDTFRVTQISLGISWRRVLR